MSRVSTRPDSGEVPAGWARTLVSPEAFAEEQRQLEHVWTFLGVTSDVAQDGDWFRASIGLRSVFVQRFGKELRAFENACAHRLYPLRHADRGNGPVICDFHGWHYDREGRAVGIPQCREVFGVLPHELGARLVRVEIATCGAMIFGRFTDGESRETLEEFLAGVFPVLEALSRAPMARRRFTCDVRANWKLAAHALYDDYHQVKIHPKTFGKNGAAILDHVVYRRFGRHSVYINSLKPEPLQHMIAAIKSNSFELGEYMIFNISPCSGVVLFHAHGPYWYCGLFTYRAVAQDRCLLESWFHPVTFGWPAGGWRLWLRRYVEFFRFPIVMHYVIRTYREDHVVCERMQRNVAVLDRGRPFWQGDLETRIGWFEQSMRDIVEQGRAADRKAGESGGP